MAIQESNNQVWVLTLGLALALLAPGDARAQPPAAGPDEAACQSKQSGDACSLINGDAGICGPGTCSRLDYSQGSPPKATEEPCTVCSVTSAGPPVLGATSETSETTPTSESAAASKDASPTEAKPSESGDPPKTSSRCSVTDRSTPNDLGLLGSLAMGLVGWRRKRKMR